MVKARRGMAILPSRGIVTVLARAFESGVLKSTVMRIAMTALAAAMGETLEHHSLLLTCRVALFTRDALVQAGQWKLCVGVMKIRSRTPRIQLRAMPAIGSLLSAMHVLMARTALAPKAQKRPVEILQLDLRASLGGNILCGVAFIA